MVLVIYRFDLQELVNVYAVGAPFFQHLGFLLRTRRLPRRWKDGRVSAPAVGGVSLAALPSLTVRLHNSQPWCQRGGAVRASAI